jgi:hypothetical protein
MVGARSPSSEILGGNIPTIFQIQDWVESAWDNGINTQGRIETGGIKGTRKYIGTPEVRHMHFRLEVLQMILTVQRHKLCLSIWEFRKYTDKYYHGYHKTEPYNYRCDAEAVATEKGSSSKQAYDLLLEYVESYFTDGCNDFEPTIRNTFLPPLYFQHPGMLQTCIVCLNITTAKLKVE